MIVVDGASSHTSKELNLPKNMVTIKLPPYSPELNPAEQIWRILKSRYLANLYFPSLDEAIKTAEFGMKELAANKKANISLTNWPWLKQSRLLPFKN